MSPTTADVNHLRPVNRQCPLPSRLKPQASVLPTSEPPASSVIHWPEARMSRHRGSQARNCVCDQCVVGGGLERGGGAIGHGQRAGVELAGDVMQVDTQELVATRVFPVACLVSCGDQAVAGGDFGAALPHRGGSSMRSMRLPTASKREKIGCVGVRARASSQASRCMRTQRIQVGDRFRCGSLAACSASARFAGPDRCGTGFSD